MTELADYSTYTGPVRRKKRTMLPHILLAVAAFAAGWWSGVISAASASEYVPGEDRP